MPDYILMMEKISFVILFFIGCSISCAAQEYHNNLSLSNTNFQFLQSNSSLSINHYFVSAKRYVSPQYLQPVTYNKFYWQQLGYFCKLEWKIEKQTTIPFRFRLGSLEYTEHMEGEDKE